MTDTVPAGGVECPQVPTVEPPVVDLDPIPGAVRVAGLIAEAGAAMRHQLEVAYLFEGMPLPPAP